MGKGSYNTNTKPAFLEEEVPTVLHRQYTVEKVY